MKMLVEKMVIKLPKGAKYVGIVTNLDVAFDKPVKYKLYELNGKNFVVNKRSVWEVTFFYATGEA